MAGDATRPQPAHGRRELVARRTLEFYAGAVGQGWEIILEPEVGSWILDLSDDTYDRVAAAIAMPAETGPGLGRPLVDTITGSRHQDMKGGT
jgi:hypothetical protein